MASGKPDLRAVPTLRPGAGQSPDADRTPFLARRLRPPRSLVHPIQRRFLLGRIAEGLEGQVVAVHAPPGFGRTELLTAAFTTLRKPDDRFVWLTLCENDSDGLCLLHDLQVAISLAQGEAGLPVRRHVGVDAAAQDLLDTIAADPARVVVFLDDCHAARGDGLTRAIDHIFRRPPDNLRIVVSARGRPDIPLSRFRIRRLLTEISWRDLAFSVSDLRAVLGGLLDPEGARALVTVTGGWPALVQLALTVLAELPEAARRAEVLTGGHPVFREFVHEEVLPSLPGDIRDALAACSIVDQFPLALAVDLAGADFAARTLRDIEELAPVIEPVTARPGWLRLHPVVRATLAADLNLCVQSRIAGLHARAASWFAAGGYLEEAVRHASHAGDFSLATEAISRAGGVNLFIRAGHTVLARLIANIPAEVVHRSPSLRLSQALVLAKGGRVQAGREIVDELKQLALDGETAIVASGDLDHIDGMLDIYQDRNLGPPEIARLEMAVLGCGLGDTWGRGWMHNHLCIAWLRSGDLVRARLNALKALSCYREEKTPYAQVFMLVLLGMVALPAGQLAAAAGFLRDAERLAQATQWSDENLSAVVRVVLAAARYQQGHVADADALLRTALPILAKGEGWVDLYALGFTTLARSQFAMLGLEAGLAAADRGEEVAVERELPRLRLSIELLRAELLTRGGMLESAAHVMQRLPSPRDGVWPSWRERHNALLVRARLRLRQADVAGAIEDLEDLLASGQEVGAGFDLVAGRVALTEAAWLAESRDAALAALQSSIAMAHPQELLQIFVDQGEGYAASVRAIVRRFGLSAFSASAAAFVNRIAGSFHQRGQPGRTTQISALLSPREAEILRLLARGWANKEIARDLDLSESTVKFHLKNLYAKLGVSRRAMALTVARNVALVDDAFA